MSKFEVSSGRGFKVTFPNGVTVSTQFGAPNYCDNRSSDMEVYASMEHNPTSCVNAEIAVWDENDNWITKDIMLAEFGEEISDDVIGWVTTDRWAEIIIAAKLWKV